MKKKVFTIFSHFARIKMTYLITWKPPEGFLENDLLQKAVTVQNEFDEI